MFVKKKKEGDDDGDGEPGGNAGANGLGMMSAGISAVMSAGLAAGTSLVKQEVTVPASSAPGGTDAQESSLSLGLTNEVCWS
jgi:hypothetical protein